MAVTALATMVASLHKLFGIIPGSPTIVLGGGGASKRTPKKGLPQKGKLVFARGCLLATFLLDARVRARADKLTNMRVLMLVCARVRTS